MDKLTVVKIGGNVIDDAAKLSTFLQTFAAMEGPRLLVHGGGKLATQLAAQLGIAQQMVEGRRITDADTLRVVTMVYAGYINKTIVAGLQAEGCNAVGLTGADGNAVRAHKREKGSVDYGFAGDIDAVAAPLLQRLMNEGHTLVLAPITHNGRGQLLNTNADTLAREVAAALSQHYDVSLLYCFEKSGVLLNAADETSVLPQLDSTRYAELKAEGLVFAGMIPKLDNAFAALQQGVARVVIGAAEDLPELKRGNKGTAIVHHER